MLRSGATVVLADEPAVSAADVRGGAPATRGADALQPGMLIERTDAVVLAGGSAFGLAAADGVMAGLTARGRGVLFGGARVPIVAGAILFDLTHGGAKDWGEVNPYPALGRRALERAAHDFSLGNAGAGLGARAGALKGGLGSASLLYDAAGGPMTVGALVAANSSSPARRPSGRPPSSRTANSAGSDRSRGRSRQTSSITPLRPGARVPRRSRSSRPMPR